MPACISTRDLKNQLNPAVSGFFYGNEYRIFYERTSDLELARIFLSDRIERRESIIFVACNDNSECCGFTQLFPSFSSVAVKGVWILNDLYVEKTARKKGIGRVLMNKAREFAVETESRGIVLETAKSNTNAQALYESLGYEKNTEYFYSLNLE